LAFPLLGSPKPQFSDSSGSPLSSGTLAVLDPSDDTNKASYPTASDADAATNANTNPIVLDSRGEPGTGLFGLDGQSYKLVLKDSAAATIWTVTDILVPMDLPDARTTADETSASVTPTDFSYPANDIRRYGAVGDNSTECATAINNAILVATVSGGKVFIPAGQWKTTSTINMKVNVILSGEGGKASIIEANGVDALTFDFYTGFGSHGTDNIGINGTSASTKTGITQTGSLTSSDELYGVSILRTYITNFDTGIHFRQARNMNINYGWIQDVNNGIDLVGKDLVVRIIGQGIVYGAGGGGSPATKIGIKLDTFDFTDSGGVLPTEGVQISGGSQIFGFETCIDADVCNYCNIDGIDVSGLIYGIEFQTVQDKLNITNSHIAVTTSAAIAGIRGRGVAAVLAAKVAIDNNNFIASTTTGAVGVLINDTGNQNQNHVDTTNNLFTGFDVNDILYNNAGPSIISGNRCFSTGLSSDSIRVANVILGPVYIYDNHCESTIFGTAAEKNSREVIIGRNVVSATTQIFPIDTEAVIATNVITAIETGKTFFLTAAGGFTSTLPAVADGLKFRFVVRTAPSTAYIITTDGGSNLLYGTINEITATAGVTIAAQDTLNFVASTSLTGDWAEFESDGFNWYVHGATQVDNGITVSAT